MYRLNKRRRSLVYFVAVLLLSLLNLNGFSQTNAGKDFWVAQTPNIKSVRSDTARFAISISNLGSAPASITITNPVRPAVSVVVNPGTVQTFFFSTENSNLLYNLPATSANGNQVVASVFKNNVYHVTSDQNVVVYSFDPYYSIFSNDAVLQLPTHTLGKKYRAISYVFPTFSYNSFFSVIGTVDGTVLKTYDRSGNLIDNVTINKGDYFQRLNGTHLNPTADVTGWYIEASNPVGVISGSQGTAVGTSSNSSDHLSEQLLPIEALAKTYIAAPTNARPVGCVTGNCSQDVFRYVATEDNTVITTSPNVGGGVINKGQFIEVFTNVPHIVYGTKPFYGFQFMTSQLSGTPQSNIGDPALMEMPLLDQLQYQYRYVVPESYPQQFIHLLAPVGTKISIDGTIITNINWTIVGAVNGITYQVATYPTTAGVRYIAGDNKFGVVVSGYGSFASYGYLGGSGLQPINAGCVSGGPYQKFSCGNGPASIQLNANPVCDDGSIPQLQWTSENNQVQFSNVNIANPIATVPGPGVYVITLSVTCGGNTITCSTEIIVREPLEGCASLPPISLVPPPTVTVPTDPGVNYSQHVSLGTATFNAQQPAILTNDAPSQFAVGTTIVTWQVKDAYGRIATGQQFVKVVPPPSITAPSSLVVSTDANQNYATIINLHDASYWQYDETIGTYWVYENESVPTASDTAVGNQYLSASNGAATDYIITWTTSADQWGRTASTTQLIKVVPPPTIVPPPAIVVPSDAGQSYGTVSNLGTATYFAYDNHTPTNDGLTGGQYVIGTTTLNWSIVDDFGRTATAIQTVRVVPPPTITAPPAITLTVTSPTATASVANLGTATYWVYNNFSSPTNNGPGNYPVGTTIVTWKIVDQWGRTATATQQVIVNYVNTEVLGNQGCTPGFWKNWPQAWGCGYSFNAKFFTVFAGINNLRKLSATLTMGQAVDQNGGQFNALVRHATAALLNACHNGVAYPYTSAQIKAATVAMFNTGTATLGTKVFTDVEKLKDEFVRGNELGCPLGQNNAVPLSRNSNTSLQVVKLDANVYPNPTTGYFTLQVSSNDKSTQVTIRIMDAFGRQVQLLNNIPLEKAVMFGEQYASGAYYAEVSQGEQRKMIQMVKAK